MGFNKILLIDDDDDDREIFENAVLKACDLQCTSYHSTLDALKILVSGKLFPDVIFLDLNMPIMTGHEFLKAIKEINFLKEIPIIIFSTSANPSNILEAKRLGAFSYITKPYTFEQLVTVLKTIL